MGDGLWRKINDAHRPLSRARFGVNTIPLPPGGASLPCHSPHFLLANVGAPERLEGTGKRLGQPILGVRSRVGNGGVLGGLSNSTG